MRPARHWLAATVMLAALAFAGRAGAQVLDPIQYALFTHSDLGYGCDGTCACPFVFTGPLTGTFTFYRTGIDPLFTHYALLNILWSYPVPGTGKFATVTGHGTYDIGGEFALSQRMQLDVTTDGVLQQHFDSGVVPAPVAFPNIDIVLSINGFKCYDTVIHLKASPATTAVIRQY